MNQRLQMSILCWLNQVIMLLPVFLISYTTMHSAQMFGPAHRCLAQHRLSLAQLLAMCATSPPSHMAQGSCWLPSLS